MLASLKPLTCVYSRLSRKRYSIESSPRKSSFVGLSEDRADWPDDGENHAPSIYSTCSSRSASIVMQVRAKLYSVDKLLIITLLSPTL